MHRSLLLLSLVCAGTLHCSAFYTPVAPQNHRPVSSRAYCVSADLPAHDFCASVVTYPISSRLLQERAEEDGVLAPHLKKSDHATLIKDNRLDLVLSARALAEYGELKQHYLEAATIVDSRPGGVRQRAEAAGVSDSIVASMPHPSEAACSEVLRRYTCQNQYPRCVADEEFTHVGTGRPVELHTCYALCHEVQTTCLLSHRLNCALHHFKLDPLHVPPTEHELRFDAKYADGHKKVSDPFWHVDCIDSPPSHAKHLWAWLLHGGPALYLLYTLATLVLFSIASCAMGLRGESATRALLRVRRERRLRRVRYAAHMRRAQKRFVRLQEIKTQLLDAQEADEQAVAEADGAQSPTLRTAIVERRAKMTQLDNVLAQLEATVNAERAAHMAARLREVREDAASGRIDLSTVDKRVVHEYVSGDSDALSLASLLGPEPDDPLGAELSLQDAQAEVETLAAEEEEDALWLGRDVLAMGGGDSDDEREDDAGDRTSRRRFRGTEIEASPSPLSPDDDYEMVAASSPIAQHTTAQRRR